MAKRILKKQKDPEEALAESMLEAFLDPNKESFELDVSAEMNFTFKIDKEEYGLRTSDVKAMDDDEREALIEGIISDIRNDLECAEISGSLEAWTCYADITSGGVI
jgi:hypothetical protein